ncbi:MAG: O-antigen ligase family protein [Anaerolineaceae bacterium]|nr:O-antigen ligase family protein [Anaerolineaceae bacterium]
MKFIIKMVKSFYDSKAVLQIAIIVLALVTSIYGGMIWNGVYWVQIAFLVVSVVFAVITFFDRRRDRFAKLPRLEIEWVVAVSMLVIISSWVLSPVPRQGVWRISTILGYFVLLYLLIDLFANGLEKERFLVAFFGVVGLYLFSAVLEVFLAYQGWFTSIASYEIFPPSIYRFSSLIGHSNALMAVANLLAPIGLVYLIHNKRRSIRIALVFWYFLYGICLPFSSSRGGYLGLMMWGAVFFGYVLFFYKTGFLNRNRKKIIAGSILIGFVFLIIVIAFGGYLVSHPTHGTSIFSSREVMWGDALKIWQNHPWFGAGPGRIPFEILNVNATIPPRYFPNHVHSTWLQILAEFGVIGLITFLMLNIQGIRMLIRQWKVLPSEKKLAGMAYLASFTGFFFHSLLDDYSGWVFIMMVFLVLLAIYMTMNLENIKVWREINVRGIFIPIGILLVAGVYSIWIQLPFRQGVNLYEQGKYIQAAEKISSSTKRDSISSYLYTETGLAWVRVWEENGDELALEFARANIRKSINIEDSPSFLWADLAILDWYAGDHVIAIDHIRKAISISNQESSHYLIYGYFLELMNRNSDALQEYQSAISLAPDTCSHPFWQQTKLRNNFSCSLEDGLQRSKRSLTHVEQADEFIKQTEYHQAQVALQRARWVGEQWIAIDTVQAKLDIARGNDDQTVKSIEGLICNDLLFDNYVNHGLYHLIFSRWLYRTNGLDYILVPGYMQVTSNYGQFDLAEQYLSDFDLDNDPEKYNQLNEIYNTAIQAGALPSALD